MQQFFEANKATLLPIITLLVTGILSAIVRSVPSNHWALQILRAILQSGNSFGNHLKSCEVEDRGQYVAHRRGAGLNALVVFTFALAIGVSLISTACGVFGPPRVSTGQCFDWCLQVTDTVTGGTEAICYDTEAKMLAAKQAKEAKGLKVQVLK